MCSGETGALQSEGTTVLGTAYAGNDNGHEAPRPNKPMNPTGICPAKQPQLKSTSPPPGIFRRVIGGVRLRIPHSSSIGSTKPNRRCLERSPKTALLGIGSHPHQKRPFSTPARIPPL